MRILPRDVIVFFGDKTILCQQALQPSLPILIKDDNLGAVIAPPPFLHTKSPSTKLAYMTSILLPHLMAAITNSPGQSLPYLPLHLITKTCILIAKSEGNRLCRYEDMWTAHAAEQCNPYLLL